MRALIDTIALTAPLESPVCSNAARWVRLAVPPGICAAIWVMGPDAAGPVAWLTAAHYAIGLCVAAWTGLRLARMPWRATRRKRQPGASRWDWGAMLLYGLLGLQPVLEIYARLLRGDAVSLGRFALPRFVATDLVHAHVVMRLHGWNALLLLAVVGWQLAAELRLVLPGRRGASFQAATVR